jgi:hypothetical protein
MKASLKILSLLLIFSCSAQPDQKQTTEGLATNPTDSVGLAELLEPREQETLPTESNEPTTHKKPILLSSLDRTPCNINAILYSHQNIDSMSTEALDVFLSVFSEECDDNVEFSEFSQEMIFQVFGKYPSEITYLITKNDYNINALISELEAPLLDPLVAPIIMDFKSIKVKNAKIDSIIAALERANEYLNEE